MRPTDRRYAKSHEWARRDGGLVAIGITDFAVQALTDLVYLNVKKPAGTPVSRGEEFGEIESVKAVAALYAPVSGTVAEVNDVLADSIETLSRDPFGAGWLIKLRPSAPAEYDELLDSAGYERVVESEAH